ncbi:hypothetical protein CQA01_40570 [Cyclobacterium qasimii]|uniref:Uncharacterized protein n=1 Tax=Cyclobacterium qasimii TaxID=1350429 RepID=A0A512CH41_9BACT|nr:hypothetical protein CQA01_40570 [Cyclobacterium qasimii]
MKKYGWQHSDRKQPDEISFYALDAFGNLRGGVSEIINIKKSLLGVKLLWLVGLLLVKSIS